MAITLNGTTAVIYTNGVLAASAASSNTPAAFSPTRNYLGKSQFAADPLFAGKLDGVTIADYAMSAAQIGALYNGGSSLPAYTGGSWTNNADGNWSANANWNNGILPNGPGVLADFSSLDITANRLVTADINTTNGGFKFGDLAGSQTWTLTGSNTLSLDGGGGKPAGIIAVNGTATIASPMLGTGGLSKSGQGTVNLTGTNTFGAGLTVSAGTLSVGGGSSAFGAGTSTIGYLSGTGNLNLSAGNMNVGGEFRVGGSDQNGAQYVATGVVTVANATLAVSSLTVARGNYLDNTISGIITLNTGGTLVCTNDVIMGFAGTGRAKLALNGGNFIVGPTATKWLMLGYYDSEGGELALTNGVLSLDNGTSLKFCRSGNTGTNVVNQIGGRVYFFSDAGNTLGGGNLDLSYAGGASSVSIYNLNGGVLCVPQIIATTTTGTRYFNFNGGTLKPAAASANFFAPGVVTAANVRSLGAVIDTTNLTVTIGQPLVHSMLAGDGSLDGGLAKNGVGT
ncbi:MAG TPA: LamG-like jellyroll fold domain-containing protein, partial [Verrucomicrobiae bacterium]